VRRITARGRPCLVLVDEKVLSMIWVPLIMVPDNKPAFFYLDVAYISQSYVAVSVFILLSKKVFHVANCKCFI
jgi:hypothetical protein